jgi:hypothetical protein
MPVNITPLDKSRVVASHGDSPLIFYLPPRLPRGVVLVIEAYLGGAPGAEADVDTDCEAAPARPGNRKRETLGEEAADFSLEFEQSSPSFPDDDDPSFSD